MQIKIGDETFLVLSHVARRFGNPYGQWLRRLGDGEGSKEDLNHALDLLSKEIQNYEGGQSPPVSYLRADATLRRILVEVQRARSPIPPVRVHVDPADIGRRCVAWRRIELGNYGGEAQALRSALQICEEAGEVARAVGKGWEGLREGTSGNLADELGDVFLSVCAMAEEQGIDLAAVVLQRLGRMEGLKFKTKKEHTYIPCEFCRPRAGEHEPGCPEGNAQEVWTLYVYPTAQAIAPKGGGSVGYTAIKDGQRGEDRVCVVVGYKVDDGALVYVGQDDDRRNLIARSQEEGRLVAKYLNIYLEPRPIYGPSGLRLPDESSR